VRTGGKRLTPVAEADYIFDPKTVRATKNFHDCPILYFLRQRI
jgi:hypothetical protein